MSTAVTNIENAKSPAIDLPREKVELLKRTYCKGASDDELELFLTVAATKGLDPFSGQIHAVKRWDSVLKKNVMSYQVGIDGLRLIAERTGCRAGEEAPQWCGTDGVWRDVWVEAGPPLAARAVVYRTGVEKPYVGVADFSMFAQRKKDGDLTAMWKKGAAFMLAKNAEALALRKAFPAELRGLYTHEEMQQAGDPITDSAAYLEGIIEKAKTQDELLAVAARIKKLGYEDKQYLKPFYRMRREQLIDEEIDQRLPEGDAEVEIDADAQ